MSIKSTHNITREFAIEIIRKKIEEKGITDEQLANMVEEAIHNGFYNFRIVDDQYMEEIKWNMDIGTTEVELHLDDIDNLPEYNDAW